MTTNWLWATLLYISHALRYEAFERIFRKCRILQPDADFDPCAGKHPRPAENPQMHQTGVNAPVSSWHTHLSFCPVCSQSVNSKGSWQGKATHRVRPLWRRQPKLQWCSRCSGHRGYGLQTWLSYLICNLFNWWLICVIKWRNRSSSAVCKCISPMWVSVNSEPPMAADHYSLVLVEVFGHQSGLHCKHRVL